MDFNKIKKVCRPVRIIVGLALIGGAFVTGNSWLFLGVVPLVAGIANFCPLCLITKKCTIPENSES